MTLAIVWAFHLLASILILSMPNLMRREILFGVVVPLDFRSSLEGRRAIRIYRSVVAIPAIGSLIVMARSGAHLAPAMSLSILATALVGGVSFLAMNRRLKPFAVQSPTVRVVEFTGSVEPLPWFTWLGLVPMLLLLATALYLHANWENIPSRFPIHWDINGSPNRWANRSVRSVYGSLMFGGELVVWLFGLALAVWYGSRRSETLRKPMVGFVVAVEWGLALTMVGAAVGPLIHLPAGVIAVVGMPFILLGLVYLVKRTNDPSAPMDPTPNECWKGGMIYYNPNDAALFVARRDGVGFTSNMGNRWSWVMLGSIPALIAIGLFVLR